LFKVLIDEIKLNRTDEEFIEYFHKNYIPAANQSTLNTISQLYPSDPADGSPFNTGDANAITPEYKRLAAIQTDWMFSGPRRLFINSRASQQPIWAFCESYTTTGDDQ
jgi:acetylcholinesterase